MSSQVPENKRAGQSAWLGENRRELSPRARLWVDGVPLGKAVLVVPSSCSSSCVGILQARL